MTNRLQGQHARTSKLLFGFALIMLVLIGETYVVRPAPAESGIALCVGCAGVRGRGLSDRRALVSPQGKACLNLVSEKAPNRARGCCLPAAAIRPRRRAGRGGDWRRGR